jgi:hypothetical protein
MCRKTVTHLQPGPPEVEPPCETCEECFQDLLRRLSAGERRLTEMRQQMRIDVITEWRRERGSKGDAV